MPHTTERKRDLTGTLGMRLGVLNTIDSDVLMNTLAVAGSNLVKLQKNLYKSFLLALGTSQWKLSRVLPGWENTEEQAHELTIIVLDTVQDNVSLALSCMQVQLWMQSVAASIIQEGGQGTFPTEI